MKTAALVKASLLPLLFSGTAAMFAGGGWFLAHGIWRPLWPGILFFSLSFFLFTVLMIPAAMFAGIMSALGRSNRLIAGLCGVFSLGWIVLLCSFYAAVSFMPMGGFFATSLCAAAVLWAVGAAVTPWAVFARKDKDNVLFTGIVLMMTAGCLLTGGFYAAGASVTFSTTFLAVASVMSLGLLLQTLYEKIFFK